MCSILETFFIMERKSFRKRLDAPARIVTVVFFLSPKPFNVPENLLRPHTSLAVSECLDAAACKGCHAPLVPSLLCERCKTSYASHVYCIRRCTAVYRSGDVCFVPRMDRGEHEMDIVQLRVFVFFHLFFPGHRLDWCRVDCAAVRVV